MLLPLGSFSFYSFVKFGFDHLSMRRLIGTSEMRTFLCITFGIALLQGSNDCLGVVVARRLSAALFFFFFSRLVFLQLLADFLDQARTWK